jgi:ubiquinone biosynthesis protein UbiJ
MNGSQVKSLVREFDRLLNAELQQVLGDVLRTSSTINDGVTEMKKALSNIVDQAVENITSREPQTD